jgi:hypothetical protein
MRYLFQVLNGTHVRDRRGVELANNEAARSEAIEFALGLTLFQPEAWKQASSKVLVTNPEGNEILSVPVVAV